MRNTPLITNNSNVVWIDLSKDISDKKSLDWIKNFYCKLIKKTLPSIKENSSDDILNNIHKYLSVSKLNQFRLKLINEINDAGIERIGHIYEISRMLSDSKRRQNMDMDEMLFYFSTAALADEGCYTINYPIYVSMMHSVSSDEEFAQYFEVHHNMNIQYPVTVTLSGDDSQVVINTLNDLMEIIEDCQ